MNVSNLLLQSGFYKRKKPSLYGMASPVIFNSQFVIELALLFLNPRLLAFEAAKIENARPANCAALYNSNFLNIRRVDRENTLHANAIRYFANRKRFGSAAAASLNYDSLKRLYACLIAFTNFIVDYDCISGLKFWKSIFN